MLTICSDDFFFFFFLLSISRGGGSSIGPRLPGRAPDSSAFLRKTIKIRATFLFLRNKKVYILAFLRKAIKNSSIFTNFNVKKRSAF